MAGIKSHAHLFPGEYLHPLSCGVCFLEFSKLLTRTLWGFSMNAYKAREQSIGMTETQKRYLGCCKESKAKRSVLFVFNMRL